MFSLKYLIISMNYQFKYYPLKQEECDIGLAYYNFIEAHYVKNPQEWLTYDM